MPLETSRPHLKTLLGLSGDVLGCPARLRCVSKGVLGWLLGVLTSSKARLGRVLGRLGGSLGRLDLVQGASWEGLEAYSGLARVTQGRHVGK